MRRGRLLPLLFLSVLFLMGSKGEGIVRPVILLQGTASHLGQKGHLHLLHLLRQRGFTVQQRGNTFSSGRLLVRLEQKGQVLLRRGGAQRRFQIPRRYQKATVRARAVALFLEIFLETAPAPKGSSSLPNKHPSLSPSELRSPLAPSTSQPGNLSPHQRRGALSQRPSPLRPSLRQKSPTSRRVAPKPSLRRRPAAPTPRLPWRLALEAGGSLALQDSSTLPLGGYLDLSLRRRSWSLHLGVGLQQLLGTPRLHLTLLRPQLGVAFLWNLPPFSLGLEIDLALEWLFASLPPNQQQHQAARSRLGAAVALLALFPLSAHWRLQTRARFLLFPQNYRFEFQSAPLYQTSFWRLEILLGISYLFP